MASEDCTPCYTLLKNLAATPLDVSSDIELSDINDEDYVPESDCSTDSNKSFVPVAIYHPNNLSIVEHEDEASRQYPVIDTASYSESNDRIAKSHESLSSLRDLPKQFTGLNAKEKGKTKVDKKHYCIYCGKAQAKLKRHLTTVHSKERDVLLMTAGDTKQFTKIKNAGDHKHNVATLKNGHGDLVVRKRISKEASEKDFVPCPKCLGYFYFRDLWRHKCIEETCSGRKQLLKTGRLLLTPSEDKANENLESLLLNLKFDRISLAVKNDSTILLFASRECKLHFHDRDRQAHIRNKVRELGRLLVALRDATGKQEAHLQEFITPEHYKSVVDATKIIAGFDNMNHQFNTPSLALKIGQSVSRCADLLRAQAIEEGDNVKREKNQDFIQMQESKWTEDIACAAHRSLRDAKRNNVKGLPLSDDIALLSEHLEKESEDAKKKMLSNNENEKKTSWSRLCSLTLVRCIMFNRRRQGEVSKMTVEDYEKGKQQNHSEDVLKNLTQFEKGLCNQLCRIEIVGKRGRTVPVILTNSMQEAIETLLKGRCEMGIPGDNTYLFPRTNRGSIGHIRGSDCLREVTSEIPLQQPQLLRSTALRKHIATMTQLHNLKENELDVLAQYMGHDIRIHREHYRLPSATLQVAKVAKFLLSMEKGHAPADPNALDGNISDISEDGSDDDDRPVQAVPATDSIDEDYDPDAESPTPPKKSKSRGKSGKKPQRTMNGRRPWSDFEQAAVMKHLGKFVYLGTLPGKGDIEKVLEQERALSDRTWLQIKNFVRNKVVAKNRKNKM